MGKKMNKAWGLVGMLLAAGGRGAHGAANTQQAQVDVNFLAARDAFARATQPGSTAAPTLAGHPLAPCALLAAEASLDEADPDSVRRFLRTIATRCLRTGCATTG
jgi:hypothetical protein